MSRAETIYPLAKGIEKEVEKIRRDPHNSKVLLRYYKVRSCEVNMATVLADLRRINTLSSLLNKSFETATVEDIEDLIFKVDQRKNSDNTKNKYRKTMKAFYRWLRKYPKNQFPPEVMWITLKRMPLVRVKSSDLISYEDCLRITECADSLRDKALFQCTLDAGCRIGEILTVKVGEVEFNNGGAVLYCDGKTGESQLILTWSAKILAMWLNIHPFRNNAESPLWPKLYCKKPKQVSYAAIRTNFSECVRRAGFTRRVWLHLLKHVSSTYDSMTGMPDSFRRYKHHWTQDSKMPQIYEHLSRDVIPLIQSDTWKKLNESRQSTEQQTIFVKVCKRCNVENPRDFLFCNSCAFPLKESQENNAGQLTVVK